MKIEKITKDDAELFMYMVGSSKSMNYDHLPFKTKPYYEVLDNRNSDERRRFLAVYNKTKHILTEREQKILEAIYGVNHQRVTLKESGKHHGITPERTRQIVHKSERKIVSKLIEI